MTHDEYKNLLSMANNLIDELSNSCEYITCHLEDRLQKYYDECVTLGVELPFI